MIKIQVNDINSVAGQFVKRIEKSIKKNKLENKMDYIFSTSKDSNQFFECLKKIYLCNPEQQKDQNSIFKIYLKNVFKKYVRKNGKSISKTEYKTFLDHIKCKYFDYEKIIEYKQEKESHAYWLMKQLNVRTCPYCNRQYTFTVKHKNNVIRPQFDHFYPKEGKNSWPYLALSFYNLIPSCPTCNQKKSGTLIKINPYMEDFQDHKCKFVLIDKDIGNPAIIDKKNILVGFNFDKNKTIKNKCEDNIDVFGLRELYNEHKDYVEEIINKAKAYNSSCYDSLIRSFSGLGATPAEIDRYIWGNYLEMAEQDKRPLSKLTRDILEQIGIK